MGFRFPIIDMDASGTHLKNICTEAGYTPQQLCHLLELSATAGNLPMVQGQIAAEYG